MDEEWWPYGWVPFMIKFPFSLQYCYTNAVAVAVGKRGKMIVLSNVTNVNNIKK